MSKRTVKPRPSPPFFNNQGCLETFVSGQLLFIKYQNAALRGFAPISALLVWNQRFQTGNFRFKDERKCAENADRLACNAGNGCILALYMEVLKMSVASVGSTLVAPLEFPFDRGATQQAQTQAAQQRLAAAKKLEAVLPGQQPGESPPPNILHSVAADLERVSLAFNKKLQFVVDQRSNEVTVKVIDKATDKVIKELPPEELQRMHDKLKETIGFLFDERV
jgi:flagellar protein FlaG